MSTSDIPGGSDTASTDLDERKELVFRPTGHGGDLIYTLPDGQRLTRDVMERLADAGMLRRVFFDRTNTCPSCGANSILFREVCPHCHRAGIERPEVIHHFPCAGVFCSVLFGDPEHMICPKCRKPVRHVGVDHEYVLAEFTCQTCGTAASVVPTYGKCLECNAEFSAEESGAKVWYEYHETSEWDSSIIGVASSEEASARMPKVLIVDDHEDNVDLVVDLLEDRELELIQAYSGEEALRVVQDVELDLVVLDVNMPVMDGFEVARRIRSIPRCSTLPILFLTAYHTSEHDLITGLGVGANDYVLKPFEADDLLSRIETLLRRGNSARR